MCNTNRNHLLPNVLSGQSAALHQMDAPVVDSSDWVSTFSSLSDLASRLGGSALVTQLWQMMHPTGMTGASEAQAALAGFSQGRKLWVSANRMWKSGELLNVLSSWVKASFTAYKSYKKAVVDSRGFQSEQHQGALKRHPLKRLSTCWPIGKQEPCLSWLYMSLYLILCICTL